MKSILPLDELNRLETTLREMFPNGLVEEDLEDVIDLMLDLFLLAYATGNEAVSEALGFPYEPSYDKVMETVDRNIAGETWRDRVKEWFSNNGTVDDLIRIADTEMHRDANEAALNTAKEAGAKYKTWMTMLDDRVRDTHFPLQSVRVPIDADFYTFDGDKAQAPGMFERAENNVNCRCELRFE